MRSMDDIIDFSDADSIFVPKNFEGDRSDYTELKVGFYRKVPKNCALVKVNRFTGEISLVSDRDRSGNIIGGGFKIMTPIVSSSIFVPIIDRTIDYPVVSCLTALNVDAEVDIALNVRIVDPKKYIKEGRYQLKQLYIKTMSLLREYIKQRKFNEISVGRVELNDFDPRIEYTDGTFDPSVYDEFEKKYGIRILSVELKSCKLPEDLRKVYNDKAEEEQRRRAQQVRLKAEQEKAENDAKIREIEAKAKAKVIKTEEKARLNAAEEAVNFAKNNGLSKDATDDTARVMMARGSNNSILSISTGGGNASNAGDFAAAMKATNIGVSGNNTTFNSNADRLIAELKNCVALGVFSLESFETIVDNLNNNSEFRNALNSSSETVYNLYLKNILESEKQEEKKHSR